MKSLGFVMGLYDGAFCFIYLFIFLIISHVYVYKNLTIYRTYDINVVCCVGQLSGGRTRGDHKRVLYIHFLFMSFSIYVHCFISPFPVHVFTVYNLDIM